MPKSTTIERKRAIKLGIDYLSRFACEPRNFAEWGSDLVNWFYVLATRASDKQVRRTALKVGRERARQWRRDYATLPEDADADTIYDFVYGSYYSSRLGIRDQALEAQLRRAARKFPALDHLGFDPSVEPPPSNLPDQCRCGYWNKRGHKTCRQCKRQLEMQTRYKVWYVALIRTYIAADCGLTLGASYREVLKWLPRMRPYSASRNPSDPDFYDTVYAVTHVVYTLNDYDAYRLSPELLTPEYDFLVANLEEAIAMDDPEMVGEFLDSLKSFGLGNNHALIRAGTKYLLSCQNADGSWGKTNTRDIYMNYHPTLCAVCGLLDYAWRGEGLSFPGLKRSLERWAKVSSPDPKHQARH